MSVTTASFATDGVEAFFYNDGKHGQCGHGVGPPPAEKGIQGQPAEQNGRQVAANGALARVGFHRATANPRGDASLGPGQQRHDNQAQRGEDDAEITNGGWLVFYQ